MVMTEWMKSVKEALKTIPKNTPNRLGAAMKKAKLTYKKGSSASSSSNVMMKKTFKHRRSYKGRKGKGKGKGSRKHHSRRHRGGATLPLNPENYDNNGKGVGPADVQPEAKR